MFYIYVYIYENIAICRIIALTDCSPDMTHLFRRPPLSDAHLSDANRSKGPHLSDTHHLRRRLFRRIQQNVAICCSSPDITLLTFLVYEHSPVDISFNIYDESETIFSRHFSPKLVR